MSVLPDVSHRFELFFNGIYMGTLVIVGLIALIAIIFALMGLKIIQQGETKVIERLGKYHSTLPSGINIIWPVIDKPRHSPKFRPARASITV